MSFVPVGISEFAADNESVDRSPAMFDGGTAAVRPIADLTDRTIAAHQGPPRGDVTYTVRMASGETFSWTGDPVDIAGWDTTRGFLILAHGTLLNLARIESMTPIGG